MPVTGKQTHLRANIPGLIFLFFLLLPFQTQYVICPRALYSCHSQKHAHAHTHYSHITVLGNYRNPTVAHSFKMMLSPWSSHLQLLPCRHARLARSQALYVFS